MLAAVRIAAAAVLISAYLDEVAAALPADGEYSVMPMTQPFSTGLSSYFVERYRPEFHPRLPTSGAYSAQMRVLVTSNDNTGVVNFTPGLVAYTRAGSATAFFQVSSVAANVRPGSSDPSLPLLASNRWQDISGTITVGSHADINPASGPFFIAPAAWVTGVNDRTILHSSWIAYLNIAGGNP
jgi:hypothetical protein